MYTIQSHEFEELKRLFDQNDTYEGPLFLTRIINRIISESFTENYQGQAGLPAPFAVGQGLKLESEYSGYEPVLELDDKTIKFLTTMKDQLAHLFEQYDILREMHTVEGAHIPTIISTKEQYEEMKPHMDKEERVLVHTTFDKALNVL
ncbi:hypothetical protein LCGC14_1816410 [marine sediment metagenome]|uniref:Uncharacterized protein n=1 Tax=marine sediment metagenome TaxID=412755 RepID=A0A0F9JJT0_9ZZZZ